MASIVERKDFTLFICITMKRVPVNRNGSLSQHTRMPDGENRLIVYIAEYAVLR